MAKDPHPSYGHASKGELDAMAKATPAQLAAMKKNQKRRARKRGQ